MQNLKKYIIKKYCNNINKKIFEYISLDSLMDNLIHFLWINAYIIPEDIIDEDYRINYQNRIEIYSDIILNDYIKEKIDLYFND